MGIWGSEKSGNEEGNSLCQKQAKEDTVCNSKGESLNGF